MPLLVTFSSAIAARYLCNDLYYVPSIAMTDIWKPFTIRPIGQVLVHGHQKALIKAAAIMVSHHREKNAIVRDAEW